MTDDAQHPQVGRPDFQRIFEAAPGCYLVLSPDLRIIGVSAAYLAATMTERAKIVGKPLFDVFPDNPNDPAATGVGNLRASLMRVLERRQEDRMSIQKYDIRTSDGDDAPFEERYWSPLNVPVFDDNARLVAIVHSVEDVTASERGRTAVTQARLSAERLVDAVESMQEAFALFDATGQLVLSNRIYRSYLGEPVLGKPYAELRRRLMGMAVESSVSGDARPSDPFDERHPLEWTFDLTLATGKRLRVIGHRTAERGLVEVIWDLSEDERQARELRRAQVGAEVANAAKTRFLSSMSHELRTPLNAILGFAQLLQRDRREPLSARHLERVEHIYRAGEQLLRLIDEVLDLSQIESGKLEVVPEPTDVTQVISIVVSILQSQADSFGVALKVAEAPDQLPWAEADPNRLKQILLNLVSNAIKYNRPGGSVTIRSDVTSSGRLRITVEDSGLGIPLEQQAKLFEPFHRAGQEAGPIPGTGIGLALSRQLAELMHGLVSYSSQPGAGSSFWVELLVYRGEDVPSLAAVTSTAMKETQLAGKTLLYVEDHAANVAFMRELCATLEGVRLLIASTAEQGIELARAEQPDLIAMDLSLPGMSGARALLALRADPSTSKIPVVAVTAAASARDPQAGVDFDAYCTKPLQIEAFLATLASLLDR